MAVTRQQVTELYVATFNRAPDAAGLDYWVNSGLTIEGIAQSFFDQAETQTKYPEGTTESDFVTAIYNNLFGHAPDADGLAYWVAELTGTEEVPANMTRSVMIEAMKNGALGTDATIIANKATVGLAYADAGLEGTGFSLATVTADTATVDSALLEVGDLTVVESGQTYAIAAASTGVVEGTALSFTVTLGTAVSTDTVINYQIQGVAVAGGTATPVDDLGILNGTVTVLAGSKTATITVTPTDDQVTEGYEGFKIALLDANFATIASSGNVAISDAANSGQTFTLTTGVDGAPAFSGGAGNDIYTGVIDGTTVANNTFTALDALNGGAGVDVLNINNTSAAANDATDLSIATISNIETINIQAVGGITKTSNTYTAGTTEVDFSSIAGLETINTTKSTAALVKAATTTDVNVSGATGLISVIGGKDVSVTDATAAKAITVGNGAAGGDAAGTITITDTNNTGANAIVVEGGTNVTVTTTADKASSGSITVGDATNGMATGTVVVAQNTTSNGTAATAGNVTVTGGTTIDVTANMTNTAVKGGATGAITAGTYAAVAGNTTTAVTITQNAVATDFANDAAALVKETTVVTFNAMASGETLIMNGLTFTAAKALTAAEVAAAFASLTAADTQAAGGPVANGIYTGAFNTAVWTSAAVSGATVTFTATDDDETDLVFTGTATTNDAGARIPTQVKTAGTAAGASTAVNVTADFGNVTVDDNATKSITTITLDGYDAATLGAAGSGSLDALTTLTLAHSAGANIVTSSATSLTANLNAITGSTTLLGATVATLTINTSGAASATALTAAGLKYLTVNAAANLTVTPTSIAALETLTVTGAGNVTMGDISTATTTITAGSATGAISATVDGTKATVTTGSGNDSITVDTATQTKAINLGLGDDTLTYSTATMGVPTGATNGGEGTDTIKMTFASAQALDANANFATAISSFERLTISDQAVMAADADITIDLEALGFSYVTLAAGTDDTEAANPNKLILDNMVTGGTVVFNATQAATAAQASTQVNVKDAATGTADSLNIIVSADATVAVGTIVANNVETFNITATDVFTDGNADGLDDNNANHTLLASGDKVTSIVVTGDDLTLDTNSTVLTSVNASAMTGGITYTADGAAAGTTVTGGAGVDTLTASGSGDTLLGGAGNDILLGASLTTLTGGAGNDTFKLNAPTNVNSYSTITDLSSGDVIDLASATTTTGNSFVSSAITLGDTAVFQDFANAAVNKLANDNDDFGWFQFNGNTYIVANDAQADAIDANFENGTDSIIKISGLVDLSTASYNETNGTLEIA